MPRLLLSCLLLTLLLRGGCAAPEPIGGCVLAAANRREVLRAKGYAHPAIPARILGVQFGGRIGHAALVFRLDGGWWAYDDTFSSRALHLHESAFPLPIFAARAAFPRRSITRAVYLDPER